MSITETKSGRPEYLGDPTIARVAVRPRWLLALLLALIVAAFFAWLGQWQISNAIRADDFVSAEFESARPLTDLAAPAEPVSEAAGGAVVTTEGSLRADDLQIIAPRENQGEVGAWVVAHLVSTVDGAPANLAVALGWAPSIAEAERMIEGAAMIPQLEEAIEIEGRLMPPEGALTPRGDEDPLQMQSMVPAYVLNLWSGVEGPTYSGYLVLHPTGAAEALIDAAGLQAIDSVPPKPPEAVNWLNVFYAIEWVVFAGFAVFMWYRLVRDAWEKEHELKLLAAQAENDEE